MRVCRALPRVRGSVGAMGLWREVAYWGGVRRAGGDPGLNGSLSVSISLWCLFRNKGSGVGTRGRLGTALN